jgi:hypothetical protein
VGGLWEEWSEKFKNNQVWTVSVGGLMEKKANTPLKGRRRGSEKEAKNIAWIKEFRCGCAGLFFAAAK